MSTEERKVPQLRFKGFSDDWEQRKFIDIVDRISFNSSEEHLPRIEYEDIVSDEGRLNKDIFEKQRNKKGIKFKPNDILFGKLRPYLNKWLHTNFEGIAVGDFWVLRSKEVDSFFIFYLLQTPRFMSIANLSSGTKMPRSDWRITSNSYFAVSNNFHEESKIGRFFNQLVKMVELHQRRANKLKSIRQELLNKIFEIENDCEPLLRFYSFNDKWNKVSLGTVGRTQSGIGFPDSEQGGKVGIPFFKVSDMNKPGNEYEMLSANNYVSEEQVELKNWKPIKELPAIMFAKVGAAIMLNRKRIIRTPFLIDNNTMAYIFDNSWDPIFGKTLFDTINLAKFAQVGALPSYNSKDIESIVVYIPNLNEQIKVGKLFKEIDVIIEKNKDIINRLNVIKSSYLHKMFL